MAASTDTVTKEEAMEFEIDFIAATFMFDGVTSYEEARALAIKEWREFQE